MTLPLPPVTNHEGQLDPEVVQFNFDKLAQLVPETGGLSVRLRFGTGTLTWPGGSQFSNGLSPTHGLGTTPQVVVAIVMRSTTPLVVLNLTATGATTFSVVGETSDATSPANTRTDTVHWLVIG